MQTAKYTFLILAFMVSWFSVMAQPAIDFSKLEKSIENHNEDSVVFHYDRICRQISDDFGNSLDFDQFFRISHQLSGLGYDDVVSSNLERMAKKSELVSNFSPLQKFQFLNEFGYAFYKYNQLEKSDSIFRENLIWGDRFDEIPDLNIALTLNYLGLTNRRLNELDLAIAFFERAKKIRITELGANHPKVGSIYNNIGNAYKDKGDYETALMCYQKAVEIKLLAGVNSVYLNYINLGLLSSEIGNNTLALNYFKKADEIATELNLIGKQADIYLNMGGVLLKLNAYSEAYEYTLKALNIYTSVYGDDYANIGDAYQNMASIYDALDDVENFEKAIDKALAIYEKEYGIESEEVADNNNNRGMVYQKNERYSESLHYFQKALEFDKSLEVGPTERYLNTLSNIAVSYQLMGKYDSAVYYFHETVENLDVLFDGKHPLLAFCYNKLAEIYLVKQDSEKASQFVQAALYSNVIQVNNVFVRTEKCLNPGYFFDSYLILGKIYTRDADSSKSNYNEGLNYFHIADSILSAQRNFFFNKEDKIDLAKRSKYLGQMVLESLMNRDTVLNSQELELAFRYIEKSKNLVLLQSISENQGKDYVGIPDTVLIKEEEILENINLFAHQIKVESDSLNKVQLEEKLFQKKLEYKTLIEELEKDYPDYYELKYKEEVPLVADIQSILNTKTAILSYFLTEESLYRFSITKQNAKLEKLPIENLGDHLTGMRKGIVLQLDQIYLEKAQLLYKILVPENLSENINAVVVIPDGGLSVLPFEALLTGSNNKKLNSKNWPFMLKRFKICYSPSFSLWMKFQNNQDDLNNEKSLLAFAPIFDNENSIEGLQESSLSGMLNIAYNSNVNNLGLAPLPESKTEVQHIDQLFKSSHNKSDLYLSSDAYKGNFISQNLGNYQFIHIATHGFVDRKRPELSGLFFTPVSGLDYDNVLYTGEIYNLKLNADLLTLSACETGLGKVAEGEGILGFSRAFLYAGAKNLVLSLWKVNDSSTSSLMTHFYGNILDHDMNFAQALAEAKNNLVQSADYSHPYYWAPFILIGN